MLLGEWLNLPLRAQYGLSTPAPTEQRGAAFDLTWFAVIAAEVGDASVVRAWSLEARDLLSAAVVARPLVPKSRRCTSERQSREVADEIGHLLVVKPIAGDGTCGGCGPASSWGAGGRRGSARPTALRR